MTIETFRLNAATAQLEMEPGQVAAVALREGERLTITAMTGNVGGDLSFVGFDQSLSRNVNGWNAHRRPVLVYHAKEGMSLYDGDANAVLAVGPGRSAGGNDIMLPGCWSELYEDGRPGCRDLVSHALGIPRRDLQGMLSFFALYDLHDEFYDGCTGAPINAGDFCSFTALKDVTVGVSVCPDSEIPGFESGRLRLVVDRPE